MGQKLVIDRLVLHLPAQAKGNAGNFARKVGKQVASTLGKQLARGQPLPSGTSLTIDVAGPRSGEARSLFERRLAQTTSNSLIGGAGRGGGRHGG